MLKKQKTLILFLLPCSFVLLVGCGGNQANDDFKIGLIMVGPQTDHGWNQAHYEGVQYVAEKMGIGQEGIITFEKLNPADNPNITLEQVVDDMVEQGADFIITNSAEMADASNTAAKAHPEIEFVHASGDDALDKTAPANLSNVMGRMEYGKMMGGCAAALATQTGKISYLGPLIDPETRRLTSSAYLGAKYCWETIRGETTPINFEVVWIGFWFNIPGVTLDPTQVVNDFFNNGSDVVISGIDTTEAVVVAGQRAKAGEAVYAVPYDYIGACREATDVCLGVPFFNWGPDYLKLATASRDGDWEQVWWWTGPDWGDINNPDTSMIGWQNGAALSAEHQAHLDTFIAGLGDGSINLWSGPLNFQDGSPFVAADEVATDEQIWNLSQLLEGMSGISQVDN